MSAKGLLKAESGLAVKGLEPAAKGPGPAAKGPGAETTGPGVEETRRPALRPKLVLRCGVSIANLN